jgi:hypothetical protein
VAVIALPLEVQRVNLLGIKFIRVRQAGENRITISTIQHCSVAAGAIGICIRKTPGLVTVRTANIQVFAGQQRVVHSMLHRLFQEGYDLCWDAAVQHSRIGRFYDRGRCVVSHDPFLQAHHSGILLSGRESHHDRSSSDQHSLQPAL